MIGQTVSHYLVRDTLSHGGGSVVYRAEDVALRREVVLKFLSPEQTDAGSIARFHHEARTVSSLNHPNICTVYEIGEHEGRPYLAMELLDGEVLSRIINGQPIDPYRIVELAVQMADGLEAAHAEGIIHRDLKPANVCVTRDDRVKLLDFGLAVLVPKRPSTNSARLAALSSSTAGTIPYMSPEQARAEGLDRRTDLFSLGTVLYEMATGRRPFAGATPADVLDAIVNRVPTPVRELAPAVPAELERIIDKALEKNARLRYQTASDVRADLLRLKRALDSTPHPQRAARPRIVAGWGTRQAAIAIGVAAVAVVGAAALPGMLANRQGQPVAAPPVPVPSGSDRPLAAASPATPAPQAAAAPTPKRTRPAAKAGPGAAPMEPSARAAIAAPASAEPVPELPVRPAFADDLRLARQQIDLKLYDQALESLRRIAQAAAARESADASFLIASIHETRGNQDGATSAYLEFANRHAEDARAPEALVKVAQSTLRSGRAGKEADARRILTDVARRYAASSWAPRALLLRGEIEERQRVWERDAELGTSVPSALITYRDASRRYPSNAAGVGALARLARVYADTKRYDLAAGAFAQLAASDEENRYDAWFNAGEIYEKRLKDTARARAAYARVPASSSRYAEAQKRLRK